MADPKGFLTTPRELPKRRPVDVRIKDWKEVYQEQEFSDLQKQAGRCMDCGGSRICEIGRASCRERV